MRTSYILQLKDFGILFCLGALIGIIYGILNIFFKIKHFWVLQIVLDVIICLLSCFVFIVSINSINMGEFRFFLLLGYILGFCIERITLGKLFAKGFKYVYTKLEKSRKKFINSKIGRIIFK